MMRYVEATRRSGLVALSLSIAIPAALTSCRKPVPLAQGPRTEARAGHALDVRAFGADATGATPSTAAIRAAIEAAAAKGGGTIVFPAGSYLTGPIRLKSNLTLLFEAGSLVKFSNQFDDYLPMIRARWEGTEVNTFSPLIHADKVENVTIEGRGVLDGQGGAWWKFYDELEANFSKTGKWDTSSKWQQAFLAANPELERPDDARRVDSAFLRPPFLQFLDSKNIVIRGVTFRNSPFWTLNPVYCDDLTISDIRIENPEDAPNTDGINPESCRNVHISNSHIDTGDDCITIKSGRDAQGRRINRPAENYTITNMTLLRGHGGVVIGSEMSGGVRNITISNSVFDGTDRGIRLKSTRGRGGVVEGLRASNLVMRDIRTEAITLNLFYSDAPAEPVSERTPRFRNIHISGVTGTAKQAALLLGLPESPLENVTLSDISLSSQKGISIKDARDVRIRGVRVDTAAGPALLVQDSTELDISGFGTVSPHRATPVIELGNVNRAYVHDCFAAPGTDVFARILGQSRGVLVEGNNLAAATTPVVTSQQASVQIKTLGTAGQGL